MAAITVDPKVVRPVNWDHVQQKTNPTAAALERGTVVNENADGKWAAGHGGGTKQSYFLLHKTLTANVAVTGVGGPGAVMYVGENLPAPGSVVYATAAGGLDDAATGNQRIGVVIAGQARPFGQAPKRLLQLD